MTAGPRARSAGDDEPGRAVVGEVVVEYLARTETFIDSQIRFLQTVEPVVLAGRRANASEFPFDAVRELLPRETPRLRGSLWELAVRAGKYRSVYEYRLAREARRAGCSVLHAHFGWMGRLCLDAQKRLRIPLVTSFYGNDLLDESFMYRNLVWTERDERLFADGTLFLALGPVMARRLEKLGCPPARIRTVRLGVDTAAFPYVARSAARGGGEPLLIVQVARLVEKKGVDLSIRAFAEARPDLGPSELWVVGEGHLREELEQLADRLEIARSVRFLGMLSHTQVQDVLRRAHIGIQPSRTAPDGDTEGSPVAVLEMQASGIPVVTTRHADIPFIVSDPDQLVAENDVGGLADALLRLAGLSERDWHEHAERARAFVEREHDARVVARTLEDAYAEALQLGPGA